MPSGRELICDQNGAAGGGCDGVRMSPPEAVGTSMWVSRMSMLSCSSSLQLGVLNSRY